MSSKLWGCIAISIILFLLPAGCIPKQQKKTPEAPVTTAVRTETVVITPIVTGRSVMKSNVREVSSSKSDIVDVLAKDTQVEITGKNGNWYKIQRTDGTGTPGFVYHKLVTLDFGNYMGTRGSNKIKATVHDAPSKSRPTPLTLPPHTQFDIIGYEQGYYEVKGENFTGWLDSEVCVADPLAPIAKTETRTVTCKAGTATVKHSSSGKQIASAPEKPKSTKSAFRSSTKTKKTTKTKTSSDNSVGAALFGAFASALLGGPQQNAQPQSQNDALKDILKSISASKELAQKTVEIREQMLSALNETRALQSLVGATVAAMNNNYKAAADTARGVRNTGMQKISIKAFIQDLSYEPTTSIEGAAVKIAENGRMLSALETKIKSEADSFSQLNAEQIQNLNSIIDAFSANLHASNALYDLSIDKSGNVIVGIDRAMTAYDEKAGPMAAEVTKQAGIIALATAELVAQISNAQNNPIGALTAIPRLIEIQEELTNLTTLFSDFQQDYEYIENNSALITGQGREISKIIMTARRKNTQVTTMLEAYYQQRLSLSKRLKDKLAGQAVAGFKQVEKKASSVALAEDMLD
ncbi:SH3 domain-containing protein [Maridesulfovibrio sp.]|uniref:SH3 domain-containing protein n=1 Tax=Maridesulfovibrio sp. TaxID=2795000 RepID=UPI002A187735|nr:SH3 domain-containing protein [Maridesulfovibrio sp.]